jgi:hypothetical protein
MAAAWVSRCTIPTSMTREAILPAGGKPRGGACSRPFAPIGRNTGPCPETDLGTSGVVGSSRANPVLQQPGPGQGASTEG